MRCDGACLCMKPGFPRGGSSAATATRSSWPSWKKLLPYAGPASASPPATEAAAVAALRSLSLVSLATLLVPTKSPKRDEMRCRRPPRLPCPSSSPDPGIEERLAVLLLPTVGPLPASRPASDVSWPALEGSVGRPSDVCRRSDARLAEELRGGPAAEQAPSMEVRTALIMDFILSLKEGARWRTGPAGSEEAECSRCCCCWPCQSCFCCESWAAVVGAAWLGRSVAGAGMTLFFREAERPRVGGLGSRSLLGGRGGGAGSSALNSSTWISGGGGVVQCVGEGRH